MNKRFTFDVAKAIPIAWDMLWANNLKQRKEDEAFEKKRGKKPYAWQRTYYLTASDVENQVRLLAAATRDGKPWNEAPIAYGNPMIWPPLRISLPGRNDLKGVVRDWLLRGNGGKIVGHNYGKGHVSGAHFRPIGEIIPDTEVKTTVARQERIRNPGSVKPRPVHAKGGKFGMLCRKKARSPFTNSKYYCRVVEDESKVTCKQCLNLLKTQKPLSPMRGSIDHMPDDNTHN